jgi:hypothetical protein
MSPDHCTSGSNVVLRLRNLNWCDGHYTHDPFRLEPQKKAPDPLFTTPSRYTN